MIHLQVPLQIPCYDLTLLVEGRLEYAKKRSLTHPQLRWFDGRCVQEQGHIHRAMLKHDYYGIQLHEGELQPSIRTMNGFRVSSTSRPGFPLSRPL